MSVHLSPRGTSASRCEYCEQREGGEERRKLINKTPSLAVHSARCNSNLISETSVLLHLHLSLVILTQVWDSPCHLSPDSQTAGTAGQRDTWEAAGEPGEIHSTLGTGDNEKESGENESISTPSTGPLTLHQHPTYTGEKWPGLTYKHLCRHTLSMCKEKPWLLMTRS